MGIYTTKIMSSMPLEMKTARLNHELNRVHLQQRIWERTKMGYRSTVAYTIRFTPIPDNNVDSPTEEAVKECKESFYTFLAEAKVKHSGAFTEEYGVEVDEENFALNFLAENVKWYESIPDVQVHENLISLAKEWVDNSGNQNIGGIFMRTGEELDDIVQESWGEHRWDWMSIVRTIEVDWA
jgi:hypothetical protein